MRQSKASQQVHPLIVELVGLAASGKTTLARALSQRDGNILVDADLALRKVRHIPVFVRTVPVLCPVLLHRGQCSRRFTWDEMKALVYLKAWPRVLRRYASNESSVILLDHGPVFKLATLNAFGPERLNSRALEPWWGSMFARWALTLDLVIWLHAPKEILIKRINGRHQRHAVKGRSELEAYDFLMRYQRSYEQILGKLTAAGRPPSLHFDTSQAPPGQIVDEVLDACRTKRGGRFSTAVG